MEWKKGNDNKRRKWRGADKVSTTRDIRVWRITSISIGKSAGEIDRVLKSSNLRRILREGILETKTVE